MIKDIFVGVLVRSNNTIRAREIPIKFGVEHVQNINYTHSLSNTISIRCIQFSSNQLIVVRFIFVQLVVRIIIMRVR